MNRFESGVVSAIIPTLGRESLVDAVRSVVSQGSIVGEILVIFSPGDYDIATVSDELRSIVQDSIALRCFKADRPGGGVARNIGLVNAQCQYVAFLDDDDVWLVGKIEAQVNRLSARFIDQVVTCRLVDDKSERVLPRVGFEGQTSVGTYLFSRAETWRSDATIQTSTLLVSAAVAKRCEFDEDLPNHQDWDFVARLFDAGAIFHFVPEVFVKYGRSGGVNVSGHIAPKAFEWAEAHFARQDPRAYAGYLATVALPAQLVNSGWRSGLAITKSVVASGGFTVRLVAPIVSAFVRTAKLRKCRRLLLPARPGCRRL